MATPSIAEKILDHLQTTLEGIDVAGGYNFDYPGGVQQEESDGGDRSDPPLIELFISGELKEMSGRYESRMDVLVIAEAVGKPTGFTQSSAVQRLRMVEDIERAVIQDPQRAQLATNTELKGHDSLAAAEGWTSVQVRFEVTFQHSLTDPGSF